MDLSTVQITRRDVQEVLVYRAGLWIAALGAAGLAIWLAAHGAVDLGGMHVPVGVAATVIRFGLRGPSLITRVSRSARM